METTQAPCDIKLCGFGFVDPPLGATTMATTTMTTATLSTTTQSTTATSTATSSSTVQSTPIEASTTSQPPTTPSDEQPTLLTITGTIDPNDKPRRSTSIPATCHCSKPILVSSNGRDVTSLFLFSAKQIQRASAPYDLFPGYRTNLNQVSERRQSRFDSLIEMIHHQCSLMCIKLHINEPSKRDLQINEEQRVNGFPSIIPAQENALEEFDLREIIDVNCLCIYKQGDLTYYEICTATALSSAQE